MTIRTLPYSANARPVSLLSRINAAFALYRQRRQLANLDAHMRTDLGLSEADILRETTRSVWDVPTGWRA
ncbi:MAG: DUF1127 domain-containing protein [Pseudomonadota bacterium]